MEKIRIEQHTFTGSAWVAAWLFTVGFLHLVFWNGVFAIAWRPLQLAGTLIAIGNEVECMREAQHASSWYTV